MSHGAASTYSRRPRDRKSSGSASKHSNAGAREGEAKCISVNCESKKRGGAPRLRLVSSSESPPAHPAHPTPSLASAPFRPGELPLTAWIPLDRATRNSLREQAEEAAVPVELWVRIAAETSRLVNEISSRAARPRSEVIAHLDHAASAPTGGAHTLGASNLCRYAAQLRKGHRASEVGAVLALRLPEEISGAWNAAASVARLEMPRWIAAALEEAPPKCVAWEAAAAEASRSLGEWAYASWLRASTSAMA